GHFGRGRCSRSLCEYRTSGLPDPRVRTPVSGVFGSPCWQPARNVAPPTAIQNNTNFDIGHTDNTQNVLNIQPVYPTHLSPNWNLITRPILPVISQPPFSRDRSFVRLSTSLALR